ncbi:MAG: hypothetical protein HN739_10780 [Gammaproteobacteria bacterium]|nr:hypothetical protein [Gammaproteobacteria bacterium]
MGEAPPNALDKLSLDKIALNKIALNKTALNKKPITRPALASDDPLNGLLEKTGLWRASSINADYKQHCSTGFTRLDQELPGTGWPADGVTEFLHNGAGIGATQTPC